MKTAVFFEKYKIDELIEANILIKGYLLQGASVLPLIDFMKRNGIDLLSNIDSRWELENNGEYVNQYNSALSFRRGNIHDLKLHRHIFLNQNVHINPYYKNVKKQTRKTALLPQGTRIPKCKEVLVPQYDRDLAVIEWILEQADGVCENCNNDAPFIKKNGDCYLEVHHLRNLADGGSDTVQNTVAICPNCHREFHSGEDSEILLNAIYKKIQRLIAE